MHVSTVLSGAALVYLGAASPTKRAPKTFTVEQGPSVPAPAGPIAYANGFVKYGKPVPEDVQVAATMFLDGTGVAVPEAYDEDYLVETDVGGTTLNLDFDTGSSDLWVFSFELPASESAGHAVYTPGPSATLEQGETWNISYGDGSSASGNVYKDWVAVGQLNVTNQGVETAEQVSSEFTDRTNLDGLMGLGFDNINTAKPQKQETFTDNAIAEGLLSQPLFTADLKKGTAGTYDFGFIDDSKHTGSITYTPVDTANGYWEFTGSGYAIGSGSFVPTSIDAIADTGTTLLYLPQVIVTAYYLQVSGAYYSLYYGGYVFSCSATLPSITLGIGSYHSVVPGSYINYAPVEDGSSTCYGGIQSNTGIGFSIYGDIWLKSQFVVFDIGNTQLGAAPKNLS